MKWLLGKKRTPERCCRKICVMKMEQQEKKANIIFTDLQSSNSISDGLTDRHTGDLHLCCFRPYTMTQQDCRAQSPDIHLVLQRS
ncbi:hypothetical protein DMENIID0001_030000 [Sergentomyia squamirostris]